MTKFTIIVPVYNSEKCLNRCIDSILSQTYTDFELLLIDDGSTDNSRIICDEYGLKDSRVRVFHKKNGGVSTARNLGLNKAKGEWIIFVDSDDWIENNLIKIIDEILMKDSGINIVRYGYYRESSIDTSICVSKEDLMIYSSDKMLEQCNKLCFWGFIWNTVYCKKIIGKLRFDDRICWCEDHIFTYKYLKKCKLMYLSSKPLYHYQLSCSGLSNIRDAYTIVQVAQEEFYAILPLAGIKKAALAYYGKIKEAINVLYKYESSYKKRKLFYSSLVLLPQVLNYRSCIIKLYKSSLIPFVLKDFVLKVKIKYRNI